ncbi:hypothetical protein RP20_CCG003387 [Aedes albopictus]|nr:hypothetical protein RP20_CCG003387 [Aedes albopictus]
MVNAESGADTSKKVTLDNQTTSYGIFQINSKDWCRAGRKGGKCNKNCEGESRLNASIILRTPLGGAVEFYDHLLIISENTFLTDDISDDIECAKQIHKDQGFSYWKGWVNKCKQKPLPDISMCWN